MSRENDPETKGSAEQARMMLTGGVILSEERLKLLAPLWQATHATIRRMDELDVAGWEPATLFVWKGEQR